MLTEIDDQAFVREFYRDFCHRSVFGRFNGAVLAQTHIEVYWIPPYGDSLEINIFAGDLLGDSAIDLGWNPQEGAWPDWYGPTNAVLGRCDRAALTACVRRLLMKHGVIDDTGLMVKRGVA